MSNAAIRTPLIFPPNTGYEPSVMSRKTLNLSPPLYDYLLASGVRDDPVAADLRRVTSRRPDAAMQIAPEQGGLLTLLCRAMGARAAIEVGVFTGYSTLCIARGVGEGGRVIACDIDPHAPEVGRPYWERDGVADRIDLHIGDARETLAGLPLEPIFDFAFIDADKEHYEDYFQLCLERLRTGGLIAVDNVLWGGRVIDPSDNTPSTEAIRAFNRARIDDPRVDPCMVPIADGLLLLAKR